MQWWPQGPILHCGEYSEPIHIKGRSTALDGRKPHHEVFERHFGLQIMPHKQGYCLERFLRYGLGGRCKWLAIHHGVRVFCWRWSQFMKMQEATDHCIVYDGEESMATRHCTKEAVWLRHLLADVRYVQEGRTFIMYDNQWCIALAKNPTHHSHTKHIDVQHHFIRNKLEYQEICLEYCPTKDMIADMLTKPLAKDRHQTLTKAMDLEALAYSQSGSVEGRTLDCSYSIEI